MSDARRLCHRPWTTRATPKEFGTEAGFARWIYRNEMPDINDAELIDAVFAYVTACRLERIDSGGDFDDSLLEELGQRDSRRRRLDHLGRAFCQPMSAIRTSPDGHRVVEAFAALAVVKLPQIRLMDYPDEVIAPLAQMMGEMRPASRELAARVTPLNRDWFDENDAQVREAVACLDATSRSRGIHWSNFFPEQREALTAAVILVNNVHVSACMTERLMRARIGHLAEPNGTGFPSRSRGRDRWV